MVVEIWKVINHPSIGCFDNYSVSNKGRVKINNYRKTGRERILKQEKLKDYLRVVLFNNKGKRKTFQTHRLVGLMFLETPNTDPNNLQINHLDECKSNNCAENLQWVSARENCNYGSRNERIAEKKNKQVFQYNTNLELINIYPSATQAAQEEGFDWGAICACCRGDLKTYKGFVWSYNSLNNEQVSVRFESTNKPKQVYQYTITDLQLVNIYPSTKEAARQTEFNRSNISACCNKKPKYKTAYGFIWSYTPIETEKKIS